MTNYCIDFLQIFIKMAVYLCFWPTATIFISHARVKSLDTYQSKWLLLWAEAFCLRQPGLQGKQTHTDKSFYAWPIQRHFNLLHIVLPDLTFPSSTHTLSPTPHELFSELKIDPTVFTFDHPSPCCRSLAFLWREPLDMLLFSTLPENKF